MIADLGAVSAYGWPFTAFLAASVLGTCSAAAGATSPVPGPPSRHARRVRRRARRRRHRRHDGPAPDRPRPAGRERRDPVVAVYVAIAAVYPERSRPALFGLISGRVGAAVPDRPAGGGAGHRAVLVALGVPRARPVRRGRAGPGRTGCASAATVRPACGHRRGLVAAAAGAAIGVTAVSWAAQHPDRIGAITAVAALAVLVPALRRLLPAGSSAAVAASRPSSRPAG